MKQAGYGDFCYNSGTWETQAEGYTNFEACLGYIVSFRVA